MSLGCNLENLLILKKQTVIPLMEETKRVKLIPGISKFLETGVAQGTTDLGRLKYLIQTNGKPGFLPFPDLEKLINLSHKNPNILRLCQRANEQLTDIQEIIETQNENIHKFVDSRPQDIQILSLLLSLSETLETVTDNALFFIMKSRSLFHKIWDESFPKKREKIFGFKIFPKEQEVFGFKIFQKKREEIFIFNILEKDKHFLPPDDFIKGY